MTVLRKPIKRELPGTFDRRQWTIELQPWGINFRAKRTRKSFPISWEAIFNRCMLIAAERERKERAERRRRK